MRLTQQEILSEGFWSRFKGIARAGVKGIAKTLDYVAPELTKPIHALERGVRDIGHSMADGYKGVSDNPNDPRGGQGQYTGGQQTSSKYAIFDYNGKYYKQDLSSPPIKKANSMIIKVFEVDQDGDVISNHPRQMEVDKKGEIIRVF